MSFLNAEWMQVALWGVLGTLITMCSLFILSPASRLENLISSKYGDVRKRLIDRLGRKPGFASYRLAVRELLWVLYSFFDEPLSFKAFRRCLTIAIAYPVILFAISWVISNQGSIGSLEIIKPVEDLSIRVFYFISSLSITLLAGFLFSKAFPIPKSLSDEPEDATKEDFTRHTITVFFRGLFPSMSAARIEVNVNFFLAFSSVALVFAMLNFFADSLWWLVIIAVVGFSPNFVVFGLSTLFIFVGFTDGDVILVSVCFLFYVLLPVINAIFDWFSWAFTRYLLGYVSQENSGFSRRILLPFELLLDLFAAFVFLVALAVIIPNVIELANIILSLMPGTIYIDWRSMVLAAVEDPFGKGLAVTGMLLSTVIPTVLHLIYGIGGMFMAWSKDTRALAEEVPYVTGSDNQPEVDGAIRNRIHDVYIWSYFWYIPASVLVSGVFYSLYSLLVWQGASFGQFLKEIAFYSASWAQ